MRPSAKSLALQGALLLAVVVGASLAWFRGSARAGDDGLMSDLRRLRGGMVRVTERPFHVAIWGPEMCVSPPFTHMPNREHWIDVYVTPGAVGVMKSGQGGYPVGSIILKQKYQDADGKTTLLYTGMRKREAGYNPDVGDWEFFALGAEGTNTTAQGRIEDCMDCHKRSRETDYVTRRYMLSKAASKP